MIELEMKQLMDSMENSIKLKSRARAEDRARRAEHEREEFKEKLMRIAASQMELDGMAGKIKGTDAAVQRDQLIGLLGGF